MQRGIRWSTNTRHKTQNTRKTIVYSLDNNLFDYMHVTRPQTEHSPKWHSKSLEPWHNLFCFGYFSIFLSFSSSVDDSLSSFFINLYSLFLLFSVMYLCNQKNSQLNWTLNTIPSFHNLISSEWRFLFCSHFRMCQGSFKHSGTLITDCNARGTRK